MFVVVELQMSDAFSTSPRETTLGARAQLSPTPGLSLVESRTLPLNPKSPVTTMVVEFVKPTGKLNGFGTTANAKSCTSNVTVAL